ncbi:agmatine deiminase family protein [Fodinicurvata fenggangensis]|uniref:agmatine deiminase family protein n=1 Tax=Fodinicurvata fenggangensis TaxID=1121830 RepID=UPI0004795603|nr:agmatine deiminase family protein [Fodinicurvata fenggangensis]
MIRDPRTDGFRLPAEWETHARCWMAWPSRDDLWGDRIEEVRDSYADVAKAIARFEPVTMIANPDHMADISLKCGTGVACLPVEHDDSWIRDNGPSFLMDSSGHITGVKWGFNGWGERFVPYELDAQVPDAILDHLRISRYAADLITEGGAFHTDGEGTLIAVEPSIVNSNRNPGLTREDIEDLLLRYTGTQKLIWLPHGLAGDHTDGHVDHVCCFIKPGGVVVLACDDEDDENHQRLEANRQVLESAVDAKGRRLEIIDVPQPRARYNANGDRLPLSYINYYAPNGGLVLPAFEDPADDRAHKVLSGLFKGRDVIQLPVLDILQGGGGIHCITLQQPKFMSFQEKESS